MSFLFCCAFFPLVHPLILFRGARTLQHVVYVHTRDLITWTGTAGPRTQEPGPFCAEDETH